MTPEILHPIEIFFKNWSYTAGAVMSSILFVVAMGRIIGFAMKAHNSMIMKASVQALINQRQDNQADVIDQLLSVIKGQAADNKRYCAVINRSSSVNAKVAQLLQDKNIKIN